MPTYSYHCDYCNYQFDTFQKMSDDALTECPQCKTNNLRRLLSGGIGLIFKGSGFYITDHRSPEYLAKANADH